MTMSNGGLLSVCILSLLLGDRFETEWIAVILIFIAVINLAYAAYRIWIYPNYLSPLKDLPTPEVRCPPILQRQYSCQTGRTLPLLPRRTHHARPQR
jgi:hypothetical protein